MATPLIKRAEIKSLDIRQDGDRVILIAAGWPAITLPWQAALNLAKAIYTMAKRAEEFANAQRIINDQALLMRKGVPLGLSNRSDIQAEALKEAAWNTELRRFIPFMRGIGIPSREVFGVPSLKQSPPPKAGE